MTLLPAPFADGPVAVAVDRDVITATGPDTSRFLQGQLSQDVAGLAAGASAWSLLLQPQGKVDAWLRVTRVDDDTFVLDVDHGAGTATLARLQRFLLRTKCEMVHEVWHTVAVRGPGAAAVAPGADARFVVPAAWPGVDGVDLLGPDVALPVGVAVGTVADLDLLRVLAGVPAMGAELDEATIPAEAGIIDRSVSFTKGCYTGQELTARIDSRGGNVPRRLRGLIADAALTPGVGLVADGADVGTVTSVATDGTRWFGLAYLKRSVDVPAVVQAAGLDVTVRELPLLD